MYQDVFKLHSDLLKALAHPKRLEIIQLLRDQTLSVKEICSMLDLPQANLSQHLSILRQNQILNCHKKGKCVYYHISHQNFVKATDLLRDYLIEKHQDDTLRQELKTSITEFLPLATDPVCGMRLSPKNAAFVHHHQDQTFYFCASGCLQTFLKNYAHH